MDVSSRLLGVYGSSALGLSVVASSTQAATVFDSGNNCEGVRYAKAYVDIAAANTFWNGDVSRQLPYTHNTDWSVPNC